MAARADIGCMWPLLPSTGALRCLWRLLCNPVAGPRTVPRAVL